MANINEISEYIYRRASQLGVDPNLALGIAAREGLNERTLRSPTFGNADARGYSFGPFQLWSASRDPRRIAPGGMAYEFQQRYGAAPTAENWKDQVEFSLERMRGGTQPWYAVRNAGGVGPITEIGREFATRAGLGLPPNQPTEAVVPPSGALNVNSTGYQGAEASPGNTAMPEPVYGSDLGTGLRRLGNYLVPELVDAPTPLTPEQIRDQKERDLSFENLGRQQRGFSALTQAAQADFPQPALRPQVGQPRPFEPFRRRRGLLD